MSHPTPRILPIHLSNFSPSATPSPPSTVIRLLGTVTALHADTATLTFSPPSSSNNNSASASAGYGVTCLLARDSHLSLGGVYEVVGKVVNLDGGGAGGELGVKILTVGEWKTGKEQGQGVDWRGWEAVVEATHRTKEIFYDSGGPSE